MASSRLASTITLSAGTKMNSGFLSTNLLMSQGQATRSTFTRSRVIHFILILLEEFILSGIFQNQNAAVLGRDHIQSVGNDNRGRVRASTRQGLLTGARLGVDGFDKAGLADGDMNKPGRRIEERHV